jgi:hypothetical protein
VESAVAVRVAAGAAEEERRLAQVLAAAREGARALSEDRTLRDRKRGVDKFITLNLQQISATLQQVSAVLRALRCGRCGVCTVSAVLCSGRYAVCAVSAVLCCAVLCC